MRNGSHANNDNDNNDNDNNDNNDSNSNSINTTNNNENSNNYDNNNNNTNDNHDNNNNNDNDNDNNNDDNVCCRHVELGLCLANKSVSPTIREPFGYRAGRENRPDSGKDKGGPRKGGFQNSILYSKLQALPVEARCYMSV